MKVVFRAFIVSAAALMLSGCFQNETGPRNFDISTVTATPAGGQPDITRSLVAGSSRSYVTMVVYEASEKESKRAEGSPQAVTSGSGFVLDKEGHILTAGHVGVSRGWYVSVTGPKGRVYRGKVVDIMPDQDMALIKLSDPVGLQPVTPVDEPCMKAGDQIFSLGKPRLRGNTARFGTVASMSFGRSVRYKAFGYSDAMVLKLQTRKGESGGPVFDSRGRLAGMIVSTLSDGTGRPLNLAHAVTAPMLARFVCGNTRCSSTWRALTSRSTTQCTRTASRRTSTPG